MERVYWQAAEALRKLVESFTPNQEKHRRVWSQIFVNSKWVSEIARRESGANPILLGHDLNKVYNKSGDKSYIFLTLGFPLASPDLEGLIESLQPHKFDRSTMEVTFEESDIVLNIGKLFSEVVPSNIDFQVLFSAAHEPYTAALHWTEVDLQKIHPNDISGLVSNGEVDYTKICGIIVRDPNNQQQRLFQDCFQSPDSLPVSAIFDRTDAKYCSGWSLRELKIPLTPIIKPCMSLQEPDSLEL
ncbi:uncharacterized protein PAC_15234 [Phialocephala subalpina]|uniref:Uncharacterized protein n=1 Tax=Phialocephala subalpina TaxID=576137 RepID=A0A1L7XK05_9HELO|nr:uncharacterized protein PAC_15234 [Phialocephala subalpina]